MKASIANALTHVNLSTLLSFFGKERNYRLGRSLHASILKNNLFPYPYGDKNLLILSNSLLSMYCKCGQLSDATKVFHQMKFKDTVSWNSIIWGYLADEQFEEGFRIFNRMREAKMCPLDKATITTVLSSCTEPHVLYAISMVHSVTVVSGFEQAVPIGNALVTGYFKCGCPSSARQVFDEMPERNVVTWTAVVSALAQNSLCEGSFVLFCEMRRWADANALTYSSSLQACSGMRALIGGRQVHGLVIKSGFTSYLSVESALMDMYSKCGSMKDALTIFEAAHGVDEISMTVILTGLAQNGMQEEAIDLFVKMMKMGIVSDPDMVAAVLPASGIVTSLALGKQIHALAIKKRFSSNPFVANGLMNMYSRCGEFGESIKIFTCMEQRNSVSWNSMIAGYARHGHGHKALQLYEEMIQGGLVPTDVTFLSLLQACSHVGSVEQGLALLDSMREVYGISPRMEHYACMVDLLGRGGYLEEAKSFIEGLPIAPTALVWQALLGCCSIYGDLKMGVYAGNQLLRLDPHCTAAYVLLANLYSRQSKWEDRASVIKQMKESGVKKDPGMSWLEVDNEVHRFVVRDRNHSQAETISEALDGLTLLMKDEVCLQEQRTVACN